MIMSWLSGLGEGQGRFCRIQGLVAAGVWALAISCGAWAAGPVELKAGVVAGEPGATVRLPVQIDTNGADASTVRVGVRYDDSVLTFKEVVAGRVADDAGKDVVAGPPNDGLVFILIYGGVSVLGDGALMAIGFDIRGDAGDVAVPVGLEQASASTPDVERLDVTATGGLVVVGDAVVVSITPSPNQIFINQEVSLTAQSLVPGESAFTWRSSQTSVATVSSAGLLRGGAEGTATISATGASSGYVGRFTVTVRSLVLPMPGNLRASEGDVDGSVLLEWDAVEGTGVEYRVYRSATNDESSASPISGWIAGTSYQDDPVDNAGGGFFGCFNRNANNAKRYYYWVRARDSYSAQSDLTGPVEGQLGVSSKAKAGEKVLPAAMGPSEEQLADAHAALAIRLKGDAPVDAAQVWGTVARQSGSVSAVRWVAQSVQDGWVVCDPPAEGWTPGEVVRFMAGGVDVEGAAIGPVAYDFLICAEVAALDGKSAGEGALTEGALEAYPELAGGVGPVWELHPDGMYGVASLFEIPLPENGAGLTLYYYCENPACAGWKPVDAIDSLAAEGGVTAGQDGLVWRGSFQHGGAVRWARETVVQASASAGITPSPWGDAALLALVVLAFRAMGRRPVTVSGGKGC